jgi:hypothetical protein
MAFELQAEFTRDIIQTLYGIEDVRLPPEAYPEVFFDGHRVDLELGFRADKQDPMVLTISIPYGKCVATPEDWRALCLRLARQLPGAEWHPLTALEVRELRSIEMALFELGRREAAGARKYDA